MATTSFSESFKYGIRLFGLFVLVVLFGGGALAGGAALAVPEILAWRGTGAAETPYIAGGLILAVLGFSILVSGQFGLIYKLIADGVAQANADPAVDLTVGPAESEESETATDEQSEKPAEEQPVVADAPEQPAETEPPQEPEPPAESQPAQQAEPEVERGQAQQAPAGAQPQDQQSAQATQQQPQDEASAAGGREQTAEEIVFGSAESADDEPPADEADESTGGFEFEDEPDEQAREDVETAGNPSSDPLADNFDDE